MELSYWAATDVGRVREHNEDNFLIDKSLQLFVVADGMGGHAAGEIASNMAVHEVRDAVEAKRELIDRYISGDATVSRHDLLTMLEGAIQSACGAVFRRAQAETDKRGMGTTCSLLLIARDRAFIAHVGDTRIYLSRADGVHQITEDHSLVNELVKRGKYKREEFERSPYAKHRNAVTRAVGVYETVEIDTFDLDLLPGDSFLVCSDGLSAYLENTKLGKILTDGEIRSAPEKLIGIANTGGGHDNITAIVVRVAAEVASRADARAEELSLKLDILKKMVLFRHLTYKELVRILNVTEVKNFAADEPVLIEDTEGNEMFVILSGRVRLHKDGAPIADLGRGDHFGEMALVDRTPRSASATALERTRLLAIRRRDFYDIIRKEPQTATKLLWSFVQVLNQRLRKTTEELAGARGADGDETIAEILFED